MYDIFISHASEDKDDFVRPLALALIGKGWKVWYDEISLTVGDSLRRSIDDGLKRSKFGVVVLSPSFFAKKWPEYELDSLITKTIGQDKKVILPIWHKISSKEVADYSLVLADKVALNSTMNMDLIIAKLVEVIGSPFRPDHSFLDGNWIKEKCPQCGEMANHVGYEYTGQDHVYDVDWIECNYCGYISEKNYVDL